MHQVPKTAKDIFLGALDTQPSERPMFLNRACAGDAALQRHVETLLELYEEPDRLLDSPRIDLGLQYDTAAVLSSNIDHLSTESHGTQIGPYTLIRQLGRGGMGVVYEAEQLSLGRRVALKILPFAALLNESQLERFATEATAAARLQHESIVTVYSVGCERGIHFIAMQLIEGPSLSKVIVELRQERHPDDEQQESADTVVAKKADVLTRDEDGGHYRAVARIGREAAEALHYAHENGVLHRDIKPSNLLLDNSGHVWIADFGLARIEDESQLTRTGDILGTIHYMSPEQATGQRDQIDARADVYGLGATLYELATLRPVFDNEDRGEVIKQVVAGNPVAPHKIDPSVPRPLSLVISKAMARRLDERYQSAQELAEDLKRYLDGETVQAKPPTRLRRARAWSRRHRLVSATLVGLLILVLLLPIFAHHFFQRVPDDSQTKGQDMKVSKTAKVAAAVAAMAVVTAGVNAKKPPKPPPEPGLTLHYELKGAFWRVDEGTKGSASSEGSLVQTPEGMYVSPGAVLRPDASPAQVTCWNSDGSLNTAFGNDGGRLVHDFGELVGYDCSHDIALQEVQENDWRLVVVGTSDDWSAPWIARLLLDGSFDSSFGNEGIVDDILPNDYAQFSTVTVLSDGSIVAAGRIQDNPMSVLLVKFGPNGDIDPTFGSEGYAITNLGQAAIVLSGHGFTELPDGRLIAPGSGPDFDTSAVFMFESDGYLDISFGDMGLAEINLQPAGAEFFHSLAIQEDGKIVAVGGASTDPSHDIVYHGGASLPLTSTQKFSIARFKPDGSLDNRKFAKPKGGLQLDLGADKGHFSCVRILSDGKILAAGSGRPDPESPWDVRLYLARFQSNGTLDTSFDDDGWASLNFIGYDHNPSLIVHGDHDYVISASGWNQETLWVPYLARVWEEE